MRRADVFQNVPATVALLHDLHRGRPRSGLHLPHERAHPGTLEPPISAPKPLPKPILTRHSTRQTTAPCGTQVRPRRGRGDYRPLTASPQRSVTVDGIEA